MHASWGDSSFLSAFIYHQISGCFKLTEQTFVLYNWAGTESMFGRKGRLSMCNVLLVDMNSFYASVHQALDPTLRGKPVIVCGDPQKRHGIILAASYEAKKFGVRTAMPKWEAERLLPGAIFIKPDYSKYFDFSIRIIKILKDFSPLVEPFSIDEAFVDVSGTKDLFGTSLDIARQIKKRIWNEIGVLCSVGIGPNKVVAKMAASLQKPDGLTLVRKEDVPHKLWPLPVKALFGVGRRTEKKLNNLGMQTIGDLAHYPVEVLVRKFGVVGRVLHLSANGIDYSPVKADSLNGVKSIGNQLTLSRDYAGDEIKIAILDLAEKVGGRVRQGGYVGKTVSLCLRDAELTSYSWAFSLPEHTDITEEIFEGAVKLFETHWTTRKRVRLVGIQFSNLRKKEYEQLDLFNQKEKLRKINQACDGIRKKFGSNSIIKCSSLTEAGIFYDKQ